MSEGRKKLDRLLDRHPEMLDGGEVSQVIVERAARWAAPLALWHRFRAEGFERVPDGACLLVINHSASALAELLLVLRAWHRRYPDRRIRLLAHRIFWDRPFRWLPLLPRAGAILAHPEVARRALERGDVVAVFPGGELEVGRSAFRSGDVMLGDRAGFVRLAQLSRVPIVPVALVGSHHSYLMLPGSRRLAERLALPRLLGVRSLPLTLGGAALVLVVAGAVLVPLLAPLAALVALQALAPWPTSITMAVQEPIRIEEGEDEGAVAARVTLALQAGMDAVHGRRPSLVSLGQRVWRAAGRLGRRWRRSR